MNKFNFPVNLQLQKHIEKLYFLVKAKQFIAVTELAFIENSSDKN